MAQIIVENVVKVFAFDCFMCAINGKELKPYVMKKHNMSEEQYKEYLNVYKENLCSKN